MSPHKDSNPVVPCQCDVCSKARQAEADINSYYTQLAQREREGRVRINVVWPDGSVGYHYLKDDDTLSVCPDEAQQRNKQTCDMVERISLAPRVPYVFNRIERPAQRDETWWLIKNGERDLERRELIDTMHLARASNGYSGTVIMWLTEFNRILNYLEQTK